MLDEMKQIARGVLLESSFLTVIEGTISSMEPLCVTVEGGGTIAPEQIVTAGYLKEAACRQKMQRGSQVLLLGPVLNNQYLIMDVRE